MAADTGVADAAGTRVTEKLFPPRDAYPAYPKEITRWQGGCAAS